VEPLKIKEEIIKYIMEEDEELKKSIDAYNKKLNEIRFDIEKKKNLYALSQIYKENKLLIDLIIDNLDEIKEKINE